MGSEKSPDSTEQAHVMYIPEALTSAITLLQQMLAADTLDEWNNIERHRLDDFFNELSRDRAFSGKNSKAGIHFPDTTALVPGNNMNPGVYGLLYYRLNNEDDLPVAKRAVKDILTILEIFTLPPEQPRLTEDLVRLYQGQIARNGI